jgi:hypothetical protein
LEAVLLLLASGRSTVQLATAFPASARQGTSSSSVAQPISTEAAY